MRAARQRTSLKRRQPQGPHADWGVAALRYDDVDLRFHDRVALDEIELYAEVLSAVANADRRLTPAEIDEVLGLARPAGAEACAGN
jgi:hypothetical protein